MKNDDLNKWIECTTNESVLENMNQKKLNFVETRITKPYGIFAVVSSLVKDSVVVTKDGNQLTSVSDRDIILTVPPDSLKIPINTSLQVTFDSDS